MIVYIKMFTITNKKKKIKLVNLIWITISFEKNFDYLKTKFKIKKILFFFYLFIHVLFFAYLYYNILHRILIYSWTFLILKA